MVLPVAGYNWLGEPDSYGGRFNVDANLLDLNRLKGNGSHRLSLGGGWTLPVKDPVGGAYKLSTTVRGDSYYATDFQIEPGEPARDTLTPPVFPPDPLE